MTSKSRGWNTRGLLKEPIVVSLGVRRREHKQANSLSHWRPVTPPDDQSILEDKVPADSLLLHSLADRPLLIPTIGSGLRLLGVETKSRQRIAFYGLSCVINLKESSYESEFYVSCC